MSDAEIKEVSSDGHKEETEKNGDENSADSKEAAQTEEKEKVFKS